MFQKLSAQPALKAASVAVAVLMLTAGASLAQDRQPERNTDQNSPCGCCKQMNQMQHSS
ncbi:hypothetical protein NIES4102_42510 (plasmid) [Chondrocystis sp. NIES-4102]|nr:hypothetical protein NIES4102_42510 [Chondrocystis sp. NIES-4102]